MADPAAELLPAATPATPWLRPALWLAVAQCLTLLLLGYMLANKHRQLLADLTLSRLEVQAGSLEATIRTGIGTGLRVEEIVALPPLVDSIRRADAAISAIEIFDIDDTGRRVVLADQAQRLGRTMSDEDWRSIEDGRGFRHVVAADRLALAALVRNDADVAEAALMIHVDTSILDRKSQQLRDDMRASFALAATAMVLATLLAVAVLARRRLEPDVRRNRVAVAVLATTLLAGVGVAWQAKQLFAASLTPEIDAKVNSVGSYLGDRIARALRLGIPIEKLPGIDDYFAEVMALHSEVAGLRLTTESGAALAERIGSTAADAWIDQPVADAAIRVFVAPERGFVERRLGEMTADIAVVLLVALLVFREITGGLANTATRATRPDALRLPLFLFILTEELSRSFLPLFVHTLAYQATSLPPETAVGLPIAVYMLVFAVATPIAGQWADHHGTRRVFAAGVLASAVGFLWTALATDYWQLLPARAMCAFGYATGTMACQRQLILQTESRERARGLALFVGAVGIAAICGSSLGGVLADQFGYRPVFQLSAVIALFALLVLARLPLPTATAAAGVAVLQWRELGRLLRDRRFAALMLGAAIPAKIALAGMLFYLAPLALQQAGDSPAAIGRAIMVYFVLVAAINPLASMLSDRYGWRLSLTVIGGLLIGAGGLAGLAGSGALPVWIAIAALGVGTGLASAPMQALATEIGARTGASSVAVILRTLERLGSVIGPLWAAAWLSLRGPGGAMAAIAAVVLLGSLLALAARQQAGSACAR